MDFPSPFPSSPDLRGMMNPPPASEKSTKKVSRGESRELQVVVCDAHDATSLQYLSTQTKEGKSVCNLGVSGSYIFLQCDGLDPCLFCTETKVECSYSREPRRRGPPSGYLRYTETRVTLLETLLGLFILRAAVPIETSVADILLENIRVLQTESKSCTQDVWDAYKASWTASQAAKVLDELANTFAPFTPRPDQEGFSKPLLPTNGAQPPNSQTKQHPAESPPTMQRSPSPPVKTQENSTWVEPQVQGPSHGPPPSHASQSISFLLPSDSAFAMSRESFERTQSPPPPHTHPPQNSQSFPVHPSQGAPQEDLSALDFAFPGGAGQDTLQYPAPPPASPHHSHRHYHQEAMMDTSGDVSMIDADMSGNLVIPDGFHDHDPDSYTGSYWYVVMNPSRISRHLIYGILGERQI